MTLIQEFVKQDVDGNVKIMAFKMKSPLKACWKSHKQKGMKKKGKKMAKELLEKLNK